MKLPVKYNDLEFSERRKVREEYVKIQSGNCYYCKSLLDEPVPDSIRNKKINWRLFPENFLRHPIHLQHDHDTGMTEGAVHAYCNAVMWQYEGR